MNLLVNALYCQAESEVLPKFVNAELAKDVYPLDMFMSKSDVSNNHNHMKVIIIMNSNIIKYIVGGGVRGGSEGNVEEVEGGAGGRWWVAFQDIDCLSCLH